MLKYCYLIVLSHLYISLFNIWFSVTKELHKKKEKTIYKGKEFTPFGFKQIIHIIDWDVNIWPSNILYIKLTVATKKSFPHHTAISRLLSQNLPSASITFISLSAARTCHFHPMKRFSRQFCKKSRFVTPKQRAAILALLSSF